MVGEAATGREAVALARSARADVVLMDIRMPEMDGLTATKLITAEEDLAGVRVVILTTFELDEYVVQAIRAGASGFLSKGVEPDELLAAIRIVASGDALLSPKATRSLIAQFASEPDSVRRAGGPEVPDRPGAGGGHPRRRRPVERGHRRTAFRVAPDGEDPREPGTVSVIQALGTLTLLFALPIAAVRTRTPISAGAWRDAGLTVAGLAGIMALAAQPAEAVALSDDAGRYLVLATDRGRARRTHGGRLAVGVAADP